MVLALLLYFFCPFNHLAWKKESLHAKLATINMVNVHNMHML